MIFKYTTHLRYLPCSAVASCCHYLLPVTETTQCIGLQTNSSTLSFRFFFLTNVFDYVCCSLFCTMASTSPMTVNVFSLFKLLFFIRVCGANLQHAHITGGFFWPSVVLDPPGPHPFCNGLSHWQFWWLWLRVASTCFCTSRRATVNLCFLVKRVSSFTVTLPLPWMCIVLQSSPKSCIAYWSTSVKT